MKKFIVQIFFLAFVIAVTSACANDTIDKDLAAFQEQMDRREDDTEGEVQRRPTSDEAKSAKLAEKEERAARKNARKGLKVLASTEKTPPKEPVKVAAATLAPSFKGQESKVFGPEKKTPLGGLNFTPVPQANEDVEVELGHTPKVNLPYNEELYNLGQNAKKDMGTVCGEKVRRTTTVTHYYVPILKNFNSQACHFVEGVCHFQKNGVTHVYNYDGNPRQASPRKAIPLSEATCKSGIGYGIKQNCTHPCRSLAASVTHHKPGEVIFFKNLVGMKCGIGKYAMIHDGFMIVNDTGAKKHFNHQGRFDFFFGPCRNKLNGICQDGGFPLSLALTRSPYCRVWKPGMPTMNAELKDKVYTIVRNESIQKGDDMVAAKLSVPQYLAYRTQRGKTR